MAGKIDFRVVADAALASLESLLHEWCPGGGRREGHEFKALNPTRADSKVGSFSINLNSGAWSDFATGDKGGDAISLYAYIKGLSQLEAARALATRLGIHGTEAAHQPTRSVVPEKSSPEADSDGLAAARRRSDWIPILPTPSDAPEAPTAHPRRGRPEMTWVYRDQANAQLGVIYRFRTSDGGKEVLPCVFAEHRETKAREWRWLAFPEPRPLYGLHALGSGTVLVVEGEKCAEAARANLPETIAVVTWSGGGKAVDKSDWSPLKDRKVILWPDCDAQLDKTGALLMEAAQPGIKAMERIAVILTQLGCQVRVVAIPAPGAKSPGWDIADAIAEGWSREQVVAFIKDHLREPACCKVPGTPDQAPPEDDWRKDLVRSGNGALLAGVPNAFLCLVHRPEWRGVLAFDQFASRPVKRMPPPYERGAEGDWEAMDDSFTAFWLATRAGLAKLSSAQAAEAAEMAAAAAPFDPVRTYLEGLVWDKVERLPGWLSDFFGVPESPYAALIGRLWLVGLVKRAFEPGCKFDYMPILEGPQGRGKSTALEILSHPWFGNTDFVMGDKDSMAVMQGKWMYEVAELDSFNKADTTRVKSFVTRQFDEFRPAYGRRVLRIPRRVVLVGTTNQFEYLKDSTGNRRFWPIQCRHEIDLDGLRVMRDQLLAEAVARYRDGERVYPTREEQEALISEQQESREIGDAWEEGIYSYLNKADAAMIMRDQTSAYDILANGLKIDAGKITKEMTTRIGIVMRKLGWNKVERRNEHPRYVYERPQKAASDTGERNQGAVDVPF